VDFHVETHERYAICNAMNMKLPATFEKGSDKINVIIETPKGCGNKYAFDFETGLFKLSKILPEGMVFPAHFGFVPGTKGDDGDPLDALVLMDEMAYPGNLVECRVLGIIEAEQVEHSGKTLRNDRLITAANLSKRYQHFESLKSMDSNLIDEITKFFITYNAIENKRFRPLAYRGPSKALKVIKKQMQ
jgi:inorganic pyrophosphatase